MLLAANSGGAAIFVIAYLAVVVIGIAGLWTTFTKAGQPGWTAIIPILNILVLLKVVKRDWWWLLLMAGRRVNRQLSSGCAPKDARPEIARPGTGGGRAEDGRCLGGRAMGRAMGWSQS